MTQYTFAIGKYHGKNIQTELAKDLAAARRSVMTDLELKKESATKKGRASSAILSVGCAIFAVVWKLTREQAASNTLLAVAIAFLLVGVYLLYWNLRSDYHEYMKKAAQLLMSLNSVDSARHPCVRFTDGEMTISGGSQNTQVPYSEITAVSESERLWTLLHGRAVTVLQKADLVGGEPAAFSEFLQQTIPCKIQKIS